MLATLAASYKGRTAGIACVRPYASI